MATSKGTSSARTTASAKGGSKTDMTTKATSKPSKTTKVNTATPSRAVAEKSGMSKRTNSGGTRRTASSQAEPTKSKQAKAASSSATSTKRAATSGGATSAKGSSGGRKGSTKGGTSTGSKSKGSSSGEGVVSKVIQAVGGMFKGRTSDPISMLKKDHRLVEGLFAKVKANEDGNNKPVFKRIKTELDTHTHIEEKVLYPFLLKKGDDELQKIVREGIEEHRQAKTLLVELAEMTGTSETFKARIKVLMEDIEHHVKEEEDEMFPMVEDQFDEKVLQKLGTRLQAEKVKFKERMAARKPTRTASRARATA